MRFTSIPLVVAAAFTLLPSVAAEAQSLRTASAAESSLPLKPGVAIEQPHARQLPAAPKDDAPLHLRLETQLSEAPLLSTAWSDAMRQESVPDARPLFDRVRPMLDMPR